MWASKNTWSLCSAFLLQQCFRTQHREQPRLETRGNCYTITNLRTSLPDKWKVDAYLTRLSQQWLLKYDFYKHIIQLLLAKYYYLANYGLTHILPDHPLVVCYISIPINTSFLCMWLFLSEQVCEGACCIIKLFPTVFGLKRLLWESGSIHGLMVLWKTALNYINHSEYWEKTTFIACLNSGLSPFPFFCLFT